MKNRIIFLLFSFLNILSANAEYFRNSGKLLLVPYTKDFGIITRF